MNHRTTILLAACGALLLCMPACKKSKESEKASWTANTKKVKGLAALYPGFAAPIEARLKAATTVFEASSAQEEAEAAKTISSANQTLMKGFVKNLVEIEKTIKKLREKAVDATTNAADDAAKAGAKLATDDAKKAIDGVEAILKAGAKDEAAAEAVTKKALDDLKVAEKNLDKLISAGTKKKEATAKKEAENKGASDNVKKEEEKKAAPWKCEYCGGANDAKDLKCKGCGASRAVPKTK